MNNDNITNNLNPIGPQPEPNINNEVINPHPTNLTPTTTTNPQPQPQIPVNNPNFTNQPNPPTDLFPANDQPAVASPQLFAQNSQNATEYNSNPFIVTGKGLGSTLSTNPVSALLVAIIPYALIIFFPLGGIISAILGPIAAIIMVIILILLTVVVILRTITSSIIIVIESIKGNEVTTREAFGSLSRKHLTTFVLASLLCGILIFFGFLLFIIPGVILLARLSLVPILVYAEELKTSEAIKRSMQLTKNHTFEMLGAITAQTIISGNGLLSFVGSYSGTTKRYFELLEAEKNGVLKPAKTHWLNFALPFIGIIVAVLWIGLSILSSVASNNTNNNLNYNDDSYSSFTSISNAQSSANDIVTVNEINGLYQKLEEYYNVHGNYPGVNFDSSNAASLFPGIDSSLVVAANGKEIIVNFDNSTYLKTYANPDKTNQYVITLYGEGCDGSGNNSCTSFELGGYQEKGYTVYKYSLN